MLKGLRDDLNSFVERDPAAKNKFEIFFLYSGFKALRWHRKAHWLYKHGFTITARLLSQISRHKTGIEIHPGAKIGKALFIDHGMGVVIGETAEIGDYCTIYQNVTLGGTGKDQGKRHPTVGNNVMIGAGAKVLGPIKIGDNSRIAAGAVVLQDIPENATAVGIPAKPVRINGIKTSSLDQIHIGDPIAQEMAIIESKIKELADKQLKLKSEFENCRKEKS